MSIHVMNLVWRSTIEGSSRRFVLLAIADRADDDGYCWPGVQNIVDKTGLSTRTVDRARKSLEEDRILLQEARQTEKGGRDTNGYWINIRALEAMQRPRKGGRGPHPMEAADPPVTTTGAPRHHDPTPPVMVTPNTSGESTEGPQGSRSADAPFERSADAPSPWPATDDDTPIPPHPPSDRPQPPPNYRTEPDEWIEYKAEGLESHERNLVEAILADGQEPKKVLNKILKDREIDVWDRSSIRGKWLPYVKRKVGGWRRGEYDYARKLLADYHPDIVVEELRCRREEQTAA